MGLALVTETLGQPRGKMAALTERDKRFTAWFAFRTDDRELTEKLAGELLEAGPDREAVCERYRALAGTAPVLVRKLENLLISLEMYRIREEQAVKALSELLSACGIPLARDGAAWADTNTERERDGLWKEEGGMRLGGRNTGGGPDHPRQL